MRPATERRAGDRRSSGEPPGGSRRFRRLLVVFDPTFEHMPAVEVIATLAARMQADLLGLFIEDEDLLRAAGYPDASAVSTVSATRSSLDPAVLRRALKAQAESSRSAIERAGRERQVKVEFRVRQGRVATEALASSEEVDLVVVDWSCGEMVLRSRARRARPGTVARTIAEQTPKPVLLLRRDAPVSGPVLVAYDGSPAAEEALEIAIDLAEHDSHQVEVAFLSGNLSQIADWQEAAINRLEGHGLMTTFLHMPHAGLDALYREAKRQHATLMILEAGLPFLEGEAAEHLLGHMDCSVLLVR